VEKDLAQYAYLDGKHWAEQYLDRYPDADQFNVVFHLLQLLAKERYPNNVRDFMRGVDQCMIIRRFG
jgi:hypothetical protein